MNEQLDIAQLLLLRTADGPTIMARSDGVPFAFEEFALSTSVHFGNAAVDAVFALPVDAKHVAVVSVLPTAMRCLFVSMAAYRWIGDPFEIAQRFPASAHARGHLPTLAWPDEPRPQRRVEDLQRILKAGDAALLLGAAQALIDGTRLRIERAEPAREFVRGVWQLLPDASRGEIWPAEFTDGHTLPFHVAAMPVVGTLPPGTIGEERTKDYPPGRYELALQIAIEAGDQAALDRLLARRTVREMLKLALMMLAFAVGLVALLKFL